MQTPMIRNRTKKFVKPSIAAFNAAATQANWNNAPNFAAKHDQPDRRRHLADRVRNLHPRSQEPVGSGPRDRRAQILRLGLQIQALRPPTSSTIFRSLQRFRIKSRKKWTSISANGQAVWKWRLRE